MAWGTNFSYLNGRHAKQKGLIPDFVVLVSLVEDQMPPSRGRPALASLAWPGEDIVCYHN